MTKHNLLCEIDDDALDAVSGGTGDCAGLFDFAKAVGVDVGVNVGRGVEVGVGVQVGGLVNVGVNVGVGVGSGGAAGYNCSTSGGTVG